MLELLIFILLFYMSKKITIAKNKPNGKKNVLMLRIAEELQLTLTSWLLQFLLLLLLLLLLPEVGLESAMFDVVPDLMTNGVLENFAEVVVLKEFADVVISVFTIDAVTSIVDKTWYTVALGGILRLSGQTGEEGTVNVV